MSISRELEISALARSGSDSDFGSEGQTSDVDLMPDHRVGDLTRLLDASLSSGWDSDSNVDGNKDGGHDDYNNNSSDAPSSISIASDNDAGANDDGSSSDSSIGVTAELPADLRRRMRRVSVVAPNDKDSAQRTKKSEEKHNIIKKTPPQQVGESNPTFDAFGESLHEDINNGEGKGGGASVSLSHSTLTAKQHNIKNHQPSKKSKRNSSSSSFHRDHTFSLREMKRVKSKFDKYEAEGGMKFRAFIKEIGPLVKIKAPDATLKDMETLFKRIDANANGSVDWLEIAEFLLMNDVKAAVRALGFVNIRRFERDPVVAHDIDHYDDHPALRYLAHQQPISKVVPFVRGGNAVGQEYLNSGSGTDEAQDGRGGKKKAHSSAASSIPTNRISRYFTCSLDGTAKMWNADTLRHERTFHTSRSPVVDMCHTTWHDAIAVLGMDFSVFFYSPITGEMLRAYKGERKRKAVAVQAATSARGKGGVGGTVTKRMVDDRRAVVYRPQFVIPLSSKELEAIKYGDDAKAFGAVGASVPHLAHFVKDIPLEVTGLEDLGWVPEEDVRQNREAHRRYAKRSRKQPTSFASGGDMPMMQSGDHSSDSGSDQNDRTATRKYLQQHVRQGLGSGSGGGGRRGAATKKRHDRKANDAHHLIPNTTSRARSGSRSRGGGDTQNTSSGQSQLFSGSNGMEAPSITTATSRRGQQHQRTSNNITTANTATFSSAKKGPPSPRDRRGPPSETDSESVNKLVSTGYPLCFASYTDKKSKDGSSKSSLFSQDSSTLHPSRPKMIFGLDSGHLQIYEFDAPSLFGLPLSIPCLATIQVHRAAINLLKVCETMSLVFTASADGTIQVRHWDRLGDYGVTLGEGVVNIGDTTGGVPSASFHQIVDIGARGHTKPICSMDWSLKARLLASCARERDTLLWSPYITKPVMKLDGNPGTRAISVSFSDAAFVLTVLDSDRGVKVWDMRSYRCIHNLTDAPPERVKDLLSVAHYDDAQNCIVLGTTALRKWRVEKQAMYSSQYNGHRKPVVGMAFSSQFNQLISADDRQVIVWDVFNGFASLMRWTVPEGITNISLDANERRLLVATETGTVRMFNYVNGQLLRTCIPRSTGPKTINSTILTNMINKERGILNDRRTSYSRDWLQLPPEPVPPSSDDNEGLKDDLVEALRGEQMSSAKKHDEDTDLAGQLITMGTRIRKGMGGGDVGGGVDGNEVFFGEATNVCAGQQTAPRRINFIISTHESGKVAAYVDEDGSEAFPAKIADIANATMPSGCAAFCAQIVPPCSVLIGAEGRLVSYSLDDSTGKNSGFSLLTEVQAQQRRVPPSQQQHDTASTLGSPPNSFFSAPNGSQAGTTTKNRLASSLLTPSSTPQSPRLVPGDMTKFVCTSSVFLGLPCRDPISSQRWYLDNRDDSTSRASTLVLGDETANLSDDPLDTTTTPPKVVTTANSAPSIDCLIVLTCTAPYTVISGSSDGMLQVWSGRTHVELFRMKVPIVAQDAITSLHLSSDENVLLVGDSSGYLSAISIHRYIAGNVEAAALREALSSRDGLGPPSGMFGSASTPQTASGLTTLSAFSKVGHIKGGFPAPPLPSKLAASQSHTTYTKDFVVTADMFVLLSRRRVHDGSVTQIVRVNRSGETNILKRDMTLAACIDESLQKCDAVGRHSFNEGRRGTGSHESSSTPPSTPPKQGPRASVAHLGAMFSPLKGRDGTTTLSPSRSRSQSLSLIASQKTIFHDTTNAVIEKSIPYVFTCGSDTYVVMWDLVNGHGLMCVGDSQLRMNVLPHTEKASSLFDTCRRAAVLQFIKRYEIITTRKLRAALLLTMQQEREEIEAKKELILASQQEEMAAAAGLPTRRKIRVGTKRQEQEEEQARLVENRRRYYDCRQIGAPAIAILDFINASRDLVRNELDLCAEGIRESGVTGIPFCTETIFTPLTAMRTQQQQQHLADVSPPTTKKAANALTRSQQDTPPPSATTKTSLVEAYSKGCMLSCGRAFQPHTFVSDTDSVQDVLKHILESMTHPRSLGEFILSRGLRRKAQPKNVFDASKSKAKTTASQSGVATRGRSVALTTKPSGRAGQEVPEALPPRLLVDIQDTLQSQLFSVNDDFDEEVVQFVELPWAPDASTEEVLAFVDNATPFLDEHDLDSDIPPFDREGSHDEIDEGRKSIMVSGGGVIPHLASMASDDSRSQAPAPSSVDPYDNAPLPLKLLGATPPLQCVSAFSSGVFSSDEGGRHRTNRSLATASPSSASIAGSKPESDSGADGCADTTTAPTININDEQDHHSWTESDTDVEDMKNIPNTRHGGGGGGGKSSHEGSTSRPWAGGESVSFANRAAGFANTSLSGGGNSTSTSSAVKVVSRPSKYAVCSTGHISDPLIRDVAHDAQTVERLRSIRTSDCAFLDVEVSGSTASNLALGVASVRIPAPPSLHIPPPPSGLKLKMSVKAIRKQGDHRQLNFTERTELVSAIQRKDGPLDIAIEALRRQDALVGSLILRFGTPAQKVKYLPRFLEVDTQAEIDASSRRQSTGMPPKEYKRWRGAFCLAEPGVEVDVFNMLATGVPLSDASTQVASRKGGSNMSVGSPSSPDKRRATFRVGGLNRKQSHAAIATTSTVIGRRGSIKNLATSSNQGSRNLSRCDSPLVGTTNSSGDESSPNTTTHHNRISTTTFAVDTAGGSLGRKDENAGKKPLLHLESAPVLGAPESTADNGSPLLPYERSSLPTSRKSSFGGGGGPAWSTPSLGHLSAPTPTTVPSNNTATNGFMPHLLRGTKICSAVNVPGRAGDATKGTVILIFAITPPPQGVVASRPLPSSAPLIPTLTLHPGVCDGLNDGGDNHGMTTSVVLNSSGELEDTAAPGDHGSSGAQASESITCFIVDTVEHSKYLRFSKWDTQHLPEGQILTDARTAPFVDVTINDLLISSSVNVLGGIGGGSMIAIEAMNEIKTGMHHDGVSKEAVTAELLRITQILNDRSRANKERLAFQQRKASTILRSPHANHNTNAASVFRTTSHHTSFNTANNTSLQLPNLLDTCNNATVTIDTSMDVGNHSITSSASNAGGGTGGSAGVVGKVPIREVDARMLEFLGVRRTKAAGSGGADNMGPEILGVSLAEDAVLLSDQEKYERSQLLRDVRRFHVVDRGQAAILKKRLENDIYTMMVKAKFASGTFENNDDQTTVGVVPTSSVSPSQGAIRPQQATSTTPRRMNISLPPIRGGGGVVTTPRRGAPVQYPLLSSTSDSTANPKKPSRSPYMPPLSLGALVPLEDTFYGPIMDDDQPMLGPDDSRSEHLPTPLLPSPRNSGAALTSPSKKGIVSIRRKDAGLASPSFLPSIGAAAASSPRKGGLSKLPPTTADTLVLLSARASTHRNLNETVSSKKREKALEEEREKQRSASLQMKSEQQQETTASLGEDEGTVGAKFAAMMLVSEKALEAVEMQEKEEEREKQRRRQMVRSLVQEKRVTSRRNRSTTQREMKNLPAHRLGDGSELLFPAAVYKAARLLRRPVHVKRLREMEDDEKKGEPVANSVGVGSYILTAEVAARMLQAKERRRLSIQLLNDQEVRVLDGEEYDVPPIRSTFNTHPVKGVFERQPDSPISSTVDPHQDPVIEGESRCGGGQRRATFDIGGPMPQANTTIVGANPLTSQNTMLAFSTLIVKEADRIKKEALGKRRERIDRELSSASGGSNVFCGEGGESSSQYLESTSNPSSMHPVASSSLPGTGIPPTPRARRAFDHMGSIEDELAGKVSLWETPDRALHQLKNAKGPIFVHSTANMEMRAQAAGGGGGGEAGGAVSPRLGRSGVFASSTTPANSSHQLSQSHRSSSGAPTPAGTILSMATLIERAEGLRQEHLQAERRRSSVIAASVLKSLPSSALFSEPSKLFDDEVDQNDPLEIHNKDVSQRLMETALAHLLSEHTELQKSSQLSRFGAVGGVSTDVAGSRHKDDVGGALNKNIAYLPRPPPVAASTASQLRSKLTADPSEPRWLTADALADLTAHEREYFLTLPPIEEESLVGDIGKYLHIITGKDVATLGRISLGGFVSSDANRTVLNLPNFQLSPQELDQAHHQFALTTFKDTTPSSSTPVADATAPSSLGSNAIVKVSARQQKRNQENQRLMNYILGSGSGSGAPATAPVVSHLNGRQLMWVDRIHSELPLEGATVPPKPKRTDRDGGGKIGFGMESVKEVAVAREQAWVKLLTTSRNRQSAVESSHMNRTEGDTSYKKPGSNITALSSYNIKTGGGPMPPSSNKASSARARVGK